MILNRLISSSEGPMAVILTANVSGGSTLSSSYIVIEWQVVLCSRLNVPLLGTIMDP